MSNRFDVEQGIMRCWSVVEDIEAVYNKSDSLTMDQLQNVLLGMKELYQIKFEQLFDDFEKSIQSGKM